MNLLLWSFATLLAGYFAIQIFREWIEKRKMAQLAWLIGFFLYTFSAFGSAWAYLSGWDETIYRLWYVSAASLVAFLGAGQLYFTVKPKVAHLFLLLIIAITAVMMFKALTVPVDLTVLQEAQGEIGGAALPSEVRVFSPILTIPGSIALIGGALFTALARKSKSGLWIGIGSLIIAMGGTFTRLDLPEALPIANSIGIGLIYYGYALTQRRSVQKANA
ncbi:hypothetical protein CIG75_08610 [Tumebacillus algifaecis]|uniref:Uncharacterized protein n=1 Tax=Tumebacillus algifaecis TaxID=1214604 RepID=A0A223D0B0_9BACL|nr:hypothetical protein [Tumebacillus algifaecis]ASS75040.1 hypothetical protein CIG75_08610 [Tumebacillus algifaecis]